MTEGQDATMAFEEFHYRSKKANTMLKSLPNTKISKNQSDDKEMLEDFVNFRKLLEDRGYFKPNYLHVSFRIFELFALYAAATFMIKYNIPISILLFGLCSGRCGWIQHEGGHNSLTCNIKIDKEIQSFLLDFLCLVIQVCGAACIINIMQNPKK